MGLKPTSNIKRKMLSSSSPLRGDKRGANRVLSGGLDSSAAALILKEQGFEVIGITLLTYTSENNSPWIADAQELAKKLNIEHHVIDSRKEFKRDVIDYFVNSYLKGETPNPCIRCNEVIKWKFLYNLSGTFGADYISTGHYVRKIESNGYYYIQKGIDPAKDQSYYLWNLNQDILKKAIFPLGEHNKKDIKQIAENNGFLSTTGKKESMGVCFLQNKDYRDYLKENLPAGHPAIQPGNITDADNNVIGQHIGFPFYTIGQKRHIENIPAGHCVVKIDAQNCRLITGHRNTLYSNTVTLHTFRITPDEPLWENREVFIRIRGIDSSPGYFGRIKAENNTLIVTFNNPVWAITPGQSLVFYRNDMVIGGGVG